MNSVVGRRQKKSEGFQNRDNSFHDEGLCGDTKRHESLGFSFQILFLTGGNVMAGTMHTRVVSDRRTKSRSKKWLERAMIGPYPWPEPCVLLTNRDMKDCEQKVRQTLSALPERRARARH